MLFPEEDSEHLKQWLVTRLGQTSDADADVLADYVLALLSNDGDTETVRNLCMAEIPDFVQDNPTQFISDLFDAIHYKSYLPGAPAPPQRQTSMPFAPPTGPSIENIPEESFSEEAVREFFSQFGEIVDVSMRPYKRLSIVKYDSWDAAQAAYGSPKVIFDNRFVKVYWYTTPDALPQPPASATSANGAPKRETNSQGPVPARDTDEPMIDPEEFARKQEEAQKVHDEKAKKKLEMEAARKELEKRQEELNRVRAEETRKLKEKLEAKAKLNGDAGAPTDAKTSQTEALKAQLAKLEAEAASLGLPGLDQPLPDEGYGYRGRGGRGRGYRGRGTFAPRGFRGGRGRGGAPFVGGGAYKLDNRPKKIAVSGVDFTEMGSDEALRSHLLGIGDFTSLDPTPSTTTITFKDRFTAEKFMNSAHDEIPGVGKVEMKWVTEPLPTPVKREEGEVDMKDVGAERVREREIKREEREREENLDYEVAGDEDYIG
ncbi:putative Uncharacterized RNA-binding protein [Glarea lozoyensis 74030]|uniref:Putative Uncharacterized RNA-binding protein n=1 Tax=Glarea lozoyensis (strain ATCC 74030 / MF5533) TaxID=1104152 RepID=H0EVQ9_GLAL7|nr:putative Uncharacterized RNA-binding protein [Glarea lozoyensis 74030]